MGTQMAPNYAIIFMHSVEEEILKNTTLKPRIWRRFIDDVFIVWTHGKETLEKFLNYINQAHETIKFTAEYSTQEVPFLDTLVYKLNNKLATKVYHKKTDDKMFYTTAVLTQEVRKMQYPTVCLLDAKGSAQKIDTSIWRSKKLRIS